MVTSKSNYVYADGSWTGKSTGNYINEDGTTTSFTMYFGSSADVKEQFIPTKIIYSCPATICYFPDGTKEVVKVASDEEYIKEEGVAECIMRKLFKSRHAFLKAVNAGYENEESEVERILYNGSVEKISHDKLAAKLLEFAKQLEKDND